MFLRKVAFILTAMTLMSVVALSQVKSAETNEERAKKQKEFDERVIQMIDQSIAGANELRLAENKAIVYGIAGDLYWRFDDKRARELFRMSAAEIVAFNAEMEKEERDSTQATGFEIVGQNALRLQVLPLVAKRDAELALELLIATRPAKLNDAIARAAQGGLPTSTGMAYDPVSGQVAQELGLEQQIATLAADQNPELAMKLIKDSLAKGVSPTVLSLLQKLFTKDEKKANEIGADVIKRLAELDLARNYNDLNTALSFLQFGTRPVSTNPKQKQFAFTDAQIKDLAAKVTAALVSPSIGLTQSQSLSMMSRAIPILEKIAPDRAQVVRARQTTVQRGQTPEQRNMTQQQRMWDPSSTPEELISIAGRMTTEVERANVYQALIPKIGQIEDETRAKRLIDQIADEKTRTSAREQFESMRSGRLAAAGKLEDARRSIAGLTDRRRKIQSLVNLALQHHRRAKEGDADAATSLMTEAKQLVADYPEDGDEIEFAMMVANGYATIEPEAAFRLVEPVVDALNEQAQGWAILSKYDKRLRDFRRGELVMRIGAFGGNVLLLRYLPQLHALGRADLERMNQIADRFTRADTRLLVKLSVLQVAAVPVPARPPVK